MILVNKLQSNVGKTKYTTINKDTLNRPRRILVVENQESTRKQLKEMINSSEEISADYTTNSKSALARIQKKNYSIVLTNLRKPEIDSFDLLRTIHDRRLPITVIVMTASGNVRDAVTAMRLGAYDFLSEPVDVRQLRTVIQRVLRERSVQDEVALLRDQLQDCYSFRNVLSKNTQMHQLFETITQLKDSPTTVLIEGETGTGKEQVARAIHHTSERRSGPLVVVNCAALPESLLESELFGHEKGAFTNATCQRKGRFELADGGTLFLDEVGDIPLTMQAKLLRVLQERCFERIGGTETLSVNVRIIAATNRDLGEMVQEGTFREDLYYRINVIKLSVPALCERQEDIPILAQHFAQKYSPREQLKIKISPSAMDCLLKHRWPGNVRELENAIQRGCVTSSGGIIRRENLPEEVRWPHSRTEPTRIDFEKPLKDTVDNAVAEIERRYLRELLRRTHGNVGLCAKSSGMSRRSIGAKIKKYGIERRQYM